MRILRNEFGFSIVQGMILSAIIAGSSLVAIRLLTDQKMAQKGAETRDLIEELHNVVYTILQDRDHCKETMVRNSLQTILNTSTSAHNLTLIAAANGTGTVVQVNTAYMSNNVKVKSINLRAPFNDKRVLDITYERLNSNDANASARTKKGYGVKEIRKSVTLRIQKEKVSNAAAMITAGNFASCYAITENNTATGSSEQGTDLSLDICEDLSPGQNAFKWDSNLNTCVPDIKCPGTQIFIGVDNNGVTQCRDLAAWIDLGAVVNQNTPATGCGPGKQAWLKIDEATKRVSIVCNHL